MDRDIHAAQNMVWFYENNVGVERTKFKRMEMEALVKEALASSNQLLSEKHEAMGLKPLGSSQGTKLQLFDNLGTRIAKQIYNY